MIRSRRSRTLVAATAVLISLAAAGCSKNAGGSDSTGSTGTKAAAPVALAGKNLSKVDIAMVVNVAADYWKAGQVGFLTGRARSRATEVSGRPRRDQATTAARTHSTSGRCEASCRQLSPSSAEANTSPLRLPK
ncbi:hypothetical protein [Streptomyces pseudovenezuelae]|uniref:hypothetical protein n=1 Tax=Streptomyces pseudovenezuelae TaxID=67350 RepID=UPI0036E2BCA3